VVGVRFWGYAACAPRDALRASSSCVGEEGVGVSLVTARDTRAASCQLRSLCCLTNRSGDLEGWADELQEVAAQADEGPYRPHLVKTPKRESSEPPRFMIRLSESVKFRCA